MKYCLGAAALFAATVTADLCADGSTDDNGNWYCQEVTGITYTGVGGAGSYQRVTNMDSNTGFCTSTPNQYSGSLAPLDEEVSLHFRGPLDLKQFAVYMPSSASSTSSSKKVRRSATERRHAHAHAHGHNHANHHARGASPVEERQVGAEVTATIDGVVVSWVNEYSGVATSAAAPAPAAAAATTAAADDCSSSPVAAAPSANNSPVVDAAPANNSPVVAAAPAKNSPAAAAAPANNSPASSASSTTSGGWARQAYYDADSATANGLVFLNHDGGQGSGVFDYTFGNSLSYASPDGTTGASSPQMLADATLPSSAEIVIMTDSECSGENGDCGYYRPGNVAYHGFNGPAKAFLFEFGMPNDGQTATSIYDPVNMPAIWMLNAQIPRTIQYGAATCSCWTTGCGEFDIFEVLAPGDWRAKSTLHGNIAGGDSDYFLRPFTGTIKLGLVLYENNIHIKVLDNSTTFGDAMAESFLNEIISSTSTQDNGVSLFALNG